MKPRGAIQIYVVTNSANGKQYVGQTSQKLGKRLRGHIARAPNGFFVRDILKYGRDAFSIAALCECSSQDEADSAEELFIQKLSTMEPLGYNVNHGGIHGKLTERTKARLSQAERKPPVFLSPPMYRHGERSRSAKLTDNQVAEIRRLHKSGKQQKDIAALFGVHFSTISRIVNRNRRTHP